MQEPGYCSSDDITKVSLQVEKARGGSGVTLCWASQNNGTEPSPLTASSTGSRACTYDVVSLGNLCVDVVLHLDEVSSLPCCTQVAWHSCNACVKRPACASPARTSAFCACCAQVPPLEEVKTIEYLRRLTAQTHRREFWEVGASCNFLIAAARMGLTTAAVANLGEDVYGQFLLDVLKVCARWPFLLHLALAHVLGYKARLFTALHDAHAMLPYQHAMAASSQRSMHADRTRSVS